MGMMSPAQAPVAQLDRVLPSEGRGRGFESRLVHHIAIQTCLRQSAPPQESPPCAGFLVPGNLSLPRYGAIGRGFNIMGTPIMKAK